eukprot:scaffold913_cov233-Pinguiococcus_pyrenoidosus.AAC.1
MVPPGFYSLDNCGNGWCLYLSASMRAGVSMDVAFAAGLCGAMYDAGVKYACQLEQKTYARYVRLPPKKPSKNKIAEDLWPTIWEDVGFVSTGLEIPIALYVGDAKQWWLFHPKRGRVAVATQDHSKSVAKMQEYNNAAFQIFKFPTGYLAFPVHLSRLGGEADRPLRVQRDPHLAGPWRALHPARWTAAQPPQRQSEVDAEPAEEAGEAHVDAGAILGLRSFFRLMR